MHSEPRFRIPCPCREGYAVCLVVVLLGLVSLMAATSYQLVEALATIRNDGEAGARARLGAEAGLRRFMGERVGTPPLADTFYLDARTRVALHARRMSRLPGHRSLYLITSTGAYGDTLPLERELRRYAILEPPLEPVAALVNASGTLTVDRNSYVSGADAAASSACTAASATLAGALAIDAVYTTGGNPIAGSPKTRTAASHAAALSLLRTRWSQLTGPDTPVDYQDAWPDFGLLPAGTWPVVRYGGDLTPPSPASGRGFLIVGGTFRPGPSFAWNGVIVAGRLAPDLMSSFTFRGLLVAGMDPLAGALTLPQGPNIQYDRCHVQRSVAALARLQPLKNATWSPSG